MLLPPETEKRVKEAAYLAGRALYAIGASPAPAEQPSTAGKQTAKTKKITIEEE